MRPPNVVVAENGAVCFVSAKKFATIKLGQNLWCRLGTAEFPRTELANPVTQNWPLQLVGAVFEEVIVFKAGELRSPVVE